MFCVVDDRTKTSNARATVKVGRSFRIWPQALRVLGTFVLHTDTELTGTKSTNESTHTRGHKSQVGINFSYSRNVLLLYLVGSFGFPTYRYDHAGMHLGRA